MKMCVSGGGGNENATAYTMLYLHAQDVIGHMQRLIRAGLKMSRAIISSQNDIPYAAKECASSLDNLDIRHEHIGYQSIPSIPLFRNIASSGRHTIQNKMDRIAGKENCSSAVMPCA